MVELLPSGQPSALRTLGWPPRLNGGREKLTWLLISSPSTQAQQCLATLPAVPERWKAKICPWLRHFPPTQPSTDTGNAPWGCLNHRCSTSIWHFALQSIRCLMPVSAPVPTLLKWRNPAQHQPDTAPFSWRGFVCCINKVARYVEGEGLGLRSHATKAVEKPENTAQSDVNKQVLHILLSQIFRTLKRIGRVIESSQRQLYPVLPALTQPITQSFTWQVDRVMHFHVGEQFSNKALQPEQHKKPHRLVPLILISTGWKRNFHCFFAPVLPSSPLPDVTAFQHQKPIFFYLLNLTYIFFERQ